MRVLLFILCSLFSIGSFAHSVSGIWEGKLITGMQLRLVVHITQKGDSLFATLDSPDQGVTGIESSSGYINGDSLVLNFNKMKGGYQGKIGDTMLDGKWIQGTAIISLQLHKTNNPTTLNRPQTPVPPFSYNSEDVLYFNKDRSIQYGATITSPKKKGKYPAVLLLTGSGQQNRDEELFGHKPFAVLADTLTKMGFVVLRVDDRGMGKTTGELKNTTSADFMQDALVSLNYLKSRPEVDLKKVGLIGHSEGGMIAEMIAAKNSDISFVVLMAGPGVRGIELMTEQNEMVLRSMGRKKEDAISYATLFRHMMQQVLAGSDSIQIFHRVDSVVTDWRKTATPETVGMTTGIRDSTTQKVFASQIVSSGLNTWLRYFLNYDPAPDLKKIKAKVLALNGSLDIQVISTGNLAGIDLALARGVSAGYQTKELPGLNHLFQKCTRCTVMEYGQLEETFSPLFLTALTEWLQKEVLH